MNVLLLVSAAAGLASAAGHSFLSEKFLLRPMFAASGEDVPKKGRPLADPAIRRVIRWVFHLPSFAWAQTALATLWLADGASGAGKREALPAFAIFGAAVYFTAAIANAYALRRVHPGNVLLTIAGAALIAGAA